MCIGSHPPAGPGSCTLAPRKSVSAASLHNYAGISCFQSSSYGLERTIGDCHTQLLAATARLATKTTRMIESDRASFKFKGCM